MWIYVLWLCIVFVFPCGGFLERMPVKFPSKNNKMTERELKRKKKNEHLKRAHKKTFFKKVYWLLKPL